MKKRKTYELKAETLLLVMLFYGVAATACLFLDIKPHGHMFLGATAGMFGLWLYVSRKVRKIGKL